MDVVETIFMDMFAGLKAQCAADLATIAAQYPCEPIEAKPLRLTFEGEQQSDDHFYFLLPSSFSFLRLFFLSRVFFLFTLRPPFRSPDPLTNKRAKIATPPNTKHQPNTNAHNARAQPQAQRVSRSCATTVSRTSTRWATSTRSWSAPWARSSSSATGEGEEEDGLGGVGGRATRSFQTVVSHRTTPRTKPKCKPRPPPK